MGRFLDGWGCRRQANPHPVVRDTRGLVTALFLKQNASAENVLQKLTNNAVMATIRNLEEPFFLAMAVKILGLCLLSSGASCVRLPAYVTTETNFLLRCGDSPVACRRQAAHENLLVICFLVLAVQISLLELAFIPWCVLRCGEGAGTRGRSISVFHDKLGVPPISHFRITDLSHCWWAVERLCTNKIP